MKEYVRKAKLRKQHENELEIYKASNMSKDNIAELIKSDKAEAASNRNYEKRNYSFDSIGTHIMDQIVNDSFPTDIEPMDFDSLLENISDKALFKVLKNLKPVDKQILFFVAIEDLPYSEISEILGVSYDALCQRISRLKKYLKNL